MRPADEHLTPQEFEQLLFETADSKGNANRASAQQAQQHLSGCAVCQSVAEKLNKIDSALRALGPNQGSSKPPTRGSACPADDVWVRLAAGVIPPEEMGPYVTHAAQCDWCGPLLKQAMEDLTQAATAEEQDALQKLPSASPDWQREIAIKLAETSRRAAASPAGAGSAALSGAASPASYDANSAAPSSAPLPGSSGVRDKRRASSKAKAGLSWWPKLASAGAGLAIVAVAVWLGIRLTREPDVNQLLAQAYTEQRTIELRMPGAKYGPPKTERNAEKLEMPAEFDTAKGIIKSQLAKHPEDPVWLQAQARAYLLEWQYKKAYDALQEALTNKPNDPGLLLDKAMALYEQGKANHSSSYYNDAVNALGKVLDQDPRNAVALFNRAILYQELSLHNEALKDLNRFLAIEPTGRWADEALERLDKSKKVLNSHEQALSQPLAKPELFASLAGIPAYADELDQRIEDYQETAITDWLPQAFSSQLDPEAHQQIRTGLHALAQLLQARHGDKWMNEFLEAVERSSGPDDGLNALGHAVVEKVGDATRKYAEAEKAAGFFAAAGNDAGMLRAEVEEVHALRNKQDGAECLKKGRALAEKLKGRNYVWIQARFDADLCSCYLMTGEFELARAAVSQSLAEARKGRFPVATLRSMGIDASVDTDQGQILAAWEKNQTGLSVYWQNTFSPPRRAQQFYDDLSYAAENTDNLETALALAQLSVEMSVRAGDQILEAMTRQHYATIAARLGKLPLAAEELQKSDTLLASVSPDEGMEVYRISAQTSLAEIELEEGKIGEAESLLDSIRKKAIEIHSFTVPRAFDRVYGELLVTQGRIDDAERVFQHAVAGADQRLSRLESSFARYSWMQENSGLYRSLIQLELRKGDPRRALAAWEWYRSALFGRASVPVKSLQSLWNASELERHMADLKDRTIVSYALLSEGLAIWTFDNRGMDAKLVKVDAGTLSDMSSYFLEMCSDPQSDLARLQVRGRKLFGLLLRPVVNRLDSSRTVVIEPDEITGGLPFDALVTDDSRYFGEVYQVVLSPGLLYEQNLRAPGSLSRSSRVLVVGSTATFADSDTMLIPASDVVEEAEEVAGLFPNATLLKESGATVEAMESALRHADALHYAGHAVSALRKEGLLLFRSSNNRADTMIWNSERVNAGLLANAKLVVLSACSTGRSYRGRREIQGELVRSLLLAGVPIVVGSRWNVNSRATGQFMKLFYASLMAQQPASASVQAAEAVMRSRQETRHPYYWAAFGVFGRA